MNTCDYCDKPTKAKPQITCDGKTSVIACRDCQNDFADGDHDYCDDNCTYHQEDKSP